MNKPVIQLTDLHKYYGTTHVLKGLNLTVNAGQVIGYIGPNGAGKSTTLKIMIGLLADYAGGVSVLGYDVRTDPVAVKSRIGYVPENAALYDALSPMEYLQFIGQLYGMDEPTIDRRATELLGLFELGAHLNVRMTSFSKGMRQKVLLIAGLLHNPELIFLDEPLSGLDANAVVLVKAIIRQLADAGKTVFYSSHLMDVVEKLSDRIVIINGGEIIADGSFTDLRQAHSGSLEQLFGQLTGSDDRQDTAAEFVQVLAR